jgi:hypothetical protein
MAIGKAAPDVFFIETSERLLRSEMDLAKSREEQIDALERHWGRLCMVEDIEQTKYEVGKEDISVFAAVRGLRLAAEIKVALAAQQKEEEEGDPVDRELQKLVGTWTPVSYLMMGRKVDPSRIGVIKLEIPGPRGPSSWSFGQPTPKRPLTRLIYSQGLGNTRATTGMLTVDPAKKTVVVRFISPDDRKDDIYAYELKGDELRLCRSPKGGPPPDMTSTDQNLQTLIIYRRTK